MWLGGFEFLVKIRVSELRNPRNARQEGFPIGHLFKLINAGANLDINDDYKLTHYEKGLHPVNCRRSDPSPIMVSYLKFSNNESHTPLPFSYTSAALNLHLIEFAETAVFPEKPDTDGDAIKSLTLTNNPGLLSDFRELQERDDSLLVVPSWIVIGK